MEDFHVVDAYLLALNGGAPASEWNERKEEAEYLFRPKCEGSPLPWTGGDRGCCDAD